MRKIKFISGLLVLSMLLTVPAFAFFSDFTDVPEDATHANRWHSGSFPYYCSRNA